MKAGGTRFDTAPSAAASQEVDVRYIFLVGGFAESKALQHRAKHELENGDRRVFVPPRPGLAVVKGAVMLGLGASKRFASRLAKRTYGVRCCTTFDPRNPDHAGRETIERLDRGIPTTDLVDKFERIVARGTRIPVREVHQSARMRTVGTGKAELDCTLYLYATEAENPRWVTDPGVAKIGEIRYKARPQDRIRVELRFGAAEIGATVVNRATGAQTPTTIQYDFRRERAAGPAAADEAGGGRSAGASGWGRLVCARWAEMNKATRPVAVSGRWRRGSAGGAHAPPYHGNRPGSLGSALPTLS